MNNKFLADIQIIKNAINTNKLVIFGGAGISIDANVPSWGTLIDSLKGELDLPHDENDFLKIAQIYFNDRQEKEYIEKLRSLLGYKKLRYNEIHEELFELNPEHILTTNFDDLLEQVISKNSLPFSIIREDKDLPYSNNTKLLVKIHGDLDLGNLVFKEDDYLAYQQNHPLLDSFIKSIFSTKVVLFIGYSFNDYNLKQIVQYVRYILGSNFQNAYLLSVDKNIHLSHRQYLKNKGINVINYFDADYKIQKGSDEVLNNYIFDFLKDDNIYGSKSKYLKEVPSLSEKGQLLLNFIRFIRFYDKLKVPITEENVVNQIYDSLKRFEELKSLPQDFISKLYPFKSTLHPQRLLNFTSVLLTNKHVSDLFFNKMKITKSELELIGLDESEKSKIEFILKKLNNSLIYRVNREEENLLGYGRFSHKKENEKNITYRSGKTCSCSKCKFEKYKLRESLIETKNYLISDTTSIKEDMQKAFLNYKFGNYHQSFKMFEELATKAWLTQKYITYYIAKMNMKSLKVFLYNEHQLEEKEKDLVNKKIDDIDIDKLIFHIPYKSNEEYTLLKIIRDDKVLSKTREKIDEYYDKILKNFKLYESRYSTAYGPNYALLVYFEIYKCVNFYNENYIINDEFDEFKEVVNKGFEALIISYSTNDRYSGKIRKFDEEFFKLIIPYIKTERFIDALNEYNVERLILKEGSTSKILSYFNNFLSSFFEKNRFLETNYLHEVIDSQLHKFSFENSIENTLNNMFVFLSLIELNEEQFNLIKDNLFSFLSSYRKLNNINTKYLKWFLRNNSKNLSIEDSKIILEIFHKKMSKYSGVEILDLLSEICVQNKYEVIDNLKYAKKILSDILYNDGDSDKIIELWLMSNDEIKKYYHQIIINKLNKEFDLILYKQASLDGIINPDDYFDDYISYLNKANKINDGEKDGYSIIDGKPTLSNFLFHNELIFLYRIGIASGDPRLKKIRNLQEYVKFGLFREKYDLSKFKSDWLYLFEHKEFINEFKKIKNLKKMVESILKEKNDEELKKLYIQYFL